VANLVANVYLFFIFIRVVVVARYVDRSLSATISTAAKLTLQ
jgi:hypothetical protein